METTAEQEFLFPGTPYPGQLSFMEKLYACLDSGLSGIFQSPTGTGKTLSILCSALKWVNESQLSPGSTPACSLREYYPEPEEALLWDYEQLSGQLDEARIIYCTRTHAQIKQVMSEVRSTPLPQRRIVAMGARARLCIHPDASKAADVNEFCERLNASDAAEELNQQDEEHPPKCEYKADLRQIKELILSSPMDIEELYRVGIECKQCPYYGMREAVQFCNVIVAPYQYVLNAQIRQRIQLINKGTAVIIDEAHNTVESILECNSYTKKIFTLSNSLEYLSEMRLKEDWKISDKLPKEKTQADLEMESYTIQADIKAAEHAIQQVINFAESSPLAQLSSIGYDPRDFLRRCELDSTSSAS